jgi:hypothetical protein
MMSSNEYSLEFRDRESYLYVYLSGKDSFAASLSYWNEIADQVTKSGKQKLLVHENLVGEVSQAEIYDLIADLSKSALMNTRIAFYDENHADESVNQFGRMVAQNRGANIQVFQSLAAAERWINQHD